MSNTTKIPIQNTMTQRTKPTKSNRRRHTIRVIQVSVTQKTLGRRHSLFDHNMKNDLTFANVAWPFSLSDIHIPFHRYPDSVCASLKACSTACSIYNLLPPDTHIQIDMVIVTILVVRRHQ